MGDVAGMITSHAFLSEETFGRDSSSSLEYNLNKVAAFAARQGKVNSKPATVPCRQGSMENDSPTLHVSELDEAWALALAEAEQQARAAGRTDITSYLALRTSNDLLRKTGRDWLQTMFSIVAGEANRRGAGIQISREDDHRFKVGTATMVGSRLSLSNGVRRLFVEVGWPRTPSDGFIRGGGLGCANIQHLGIKSAGEQLRLVVDSKGVPRWKVYGHQREGLVELHESNIRNHIAILLNDSRNHQQHP
jgi:hypothetical protein